MALTLGLRALSSGDAGTLQTLKAMRQLIRQGKHDPKVLAKARELTANLPQKAYADEVRALFYFVRDKVRYVSDITGTETLQTPEATLNLMSGDCDDKVTLLAALLESIGHRTASVAMKMNPQDADFSHVFLETRIGPGWYALETTEPWPPGQSPAPPGTVRMTVYN